MKKFFSSKKKDNPTQTTPTNPQMEENMKVAVTFVSDNNTVKNYNVPHQITVNELRKLPPFDNFKDDIIFHPGYGILLTPYFQLKNLKSKSKVKKKNKKKNFKATYIYIFFIRKLSTLFI